MTRDEFWAIIEKVNWAELIAKSDYDDVMGIPIPVEKRPYEVGKVRLLEALPTLEDSQAFDVYYQERQGALYKFFTEWVDGNRDHRTTDLSEDSFGDLLAHVIGLGREVFEDVFTHPERLQKRGLDFNFTESFAYCFPHEEDYDPTALKLAREVRGLTYWGDELAECPESLVSQSEVEWRGRAVARLRAKLVVEGGTEMTQEELVAHQKAEQAKSDALSHERLDRKKAKAEAKKELLRKFEEEWSE